MKRLDIDEWIIYNATNESQGLFFGNLFTEFTEIDWNLPKFTENLLKNWRTISVNFGKFGIFYVNFSKFW